MSSRSAFEKRLSPKRNKEKLDPEISPFQDQTNIKDKPKLSKPADELEMLQDKIDEITGHDNLVGMKLTRDPVSSVESELVSKLDPTLSYKDKPKELILDATIDQSTIQRLDKSPGSNNRQYVYSGTGRVQQDDGHRRQIENLCDYIDQLLFTAMKHPSSRASSVMQETHLQSAKRQRVINYDRVKNIFSNRTIQSGSDMKRIHRNQATMHTTANIAPQSLISTIQPNDLFQQSLLT